MVGFPGDEPSSLWWNDHHTANHFKGWFRSESAVVPGRLNPPTEQHWGPGRDALGLSHLTCETSGAFFMHQLDQPPFPCLVNLPPSPLRVKWPFLPLFDHSQVSANEQIRLDNRYRNLLGKRQIQIVDRFINFSRALVTDRNAIHTSVSESEVHR
jgi:hypothetical protein